MKNEKRNLINHLKGIGFSDTILKAFENVNREDFVPEDHKAFAYDDVALSIGQGQTISQPYTIAFMLTMLDVSNGHKILEVGSGSGYVLALLSELNSNGQVFGLERIKELVQSSKEKLQNYENVKIFHRNGFDGLKEEAPFDRILVSASAQEIPNTLVEQLKVGGKLVIPVKESIFVLEKGEKGNDVKEYEGFVFVPLLKD